MAILVAIPGQNYAQTTAVEISPVKPSASKTAGNSFRAAMRKATTKARQNGTITVKQALRIKVAMFSPAFRTVAEDLAVIQMAFYDGDDAPELKRTDSGSVDRTAINWEGFLAFLERLIPLLLQLLDGNASIDLNLTRGVA